MADPTKSETEMHTHKWQPSKNATVREASNKGNTNSPQNNEEKENSDIITISRAEYENLLYQSRLLKETALRLDGMVHQTKSILSNSLNQTIKTHNVLADLEGVKDSIFSERRA